MIGVGPGVGARHNPFGWARSRPADGGARITRREVLGAERLHSVLPPREPRLRLSRGALPPAAPAGDAPPRRAAWCSTASRPTISDRRRSGSCRRTAADGFGEVFGARSIIPLLKDVRL